MRSSAAWSARRSPRTAPRTSSTGTGSSDNVLKSRRSWRRFSAFASAFALILGITWLVARGAADAGQPRLPTRAARLRRRSSRSRTGRTTRRRRWGSLRWRSSRPDTSTRTSTDRRPGSSSASALAMGAAPTRADGGSSRRSVSASRRSTRRRASRRRPRAPSILWATAHFGFPVSTTHTISGSVIGAGRGPRLLRRPLGGGGEHPGRLDPDAPGRRARRRDSWRSSPGLPGGHVIVFVLAVVIAACAFLARRIDRRRLAVPPERLATPTPRSLRPLRASAAGGPRTPSR